MTREEAIKMAKADLKCMKRDTSGQDEMCNSHKCDECSLNYERGNIGDQKEWLRLAIKALEQEPCEDAVSVTSVFEIMGNLLSIPYDFDRSITEKDVSESMDKIRELPRVTPQEPILDKIRAEIEDLDRYYDNDYFSGNRDSMFKCNDVLQILDKYKPESEVKE